MLTSLLAGCENVRATLPMVNNHRTLSYGELAWVEKEFGTTGFYIFDEAVFRNNLQRFLRAYRSIYSNSVLGYSFKTNYSPYVCKIVKEMGAYAEVVSLMEYCIARAIGYDGSRIIFNGPYKEYRDLEVAVNDGAIINVDNLAELQDLERIAFAKGVAPIKIGIRCNFEIEENKNSRFGLDVCSESVKASFQEILRRKNIEVVGLHCHFSTFTRSLDSFAERTSRIVKIAETVFHDCALKYISVGGGFFGTIPENMKGRFKTQPPTFEEYGSRVASIMKEHFNGEELTLILEPGAALVADAFSYYCKVRDIKSVRSSTYVTVNGSYQNIRPVDQGTNLPIEIISGGDPQQYSNVEIVGYTCMEFDRIHMTENADLSIGDYIKFSNVGAYTIALKAPFIKGSPPIIAINMANKIILIKRQETFEDILSTYVY